MSDQRPVDIVYAECVMNKLFSLSFLEQAQKQLTNAAQISIWKAISCVNKADELHLPLGFYWKRASEFS